MFHTSTQPTKQTRFFQSLHPQYTRYIYAKGLGRVDVVELKLDNGTVLGALI